MAISNETVSAPIAIGVDAKQNVGIHYLRGMAALLVLVHHASGYLSILYGYDEIHRYIPLFGRAGVGIFFAISGYLMASIIAKQSPESFLLRRCVRIYPMLLLVTALFWAQPWIPRHFDLLSLTMIPLGKSTAAPLGIEWTLVLEIGFYVVLFLISFAGLLRFLIPLAVIWLTVLTWYSLTHVEPPLGKATILDFLLAPANIAFAIGLMLPTLIRIKGAGTAMLISGIAIMIVAHLIPDFYLRPVVSVSTALLVGWAATSRIGAPPLLHAPLQRLGNISYPLYLVHVPVILVLYKFYQAPPYVMFLTAVAVALFVASVLESLDDALHNYGKSAIASAAKNTKVIAAVVFVIVYLAVGFTNL